MQGGKVIGKAEPDYRALIRVYAAAKPSAIGLSGWHAMNQACGAEICQADNSLKPTSAD